MGLLPLVILGAMRIVNSDDHSHSLIPLPDASLALARPGGGQKRTEMIKEALAVARGPLLKIGEYEWCEPDYRQIRLWGEALNLVPEEVIRRILSIGSLRYHTEDGEGRMHPQTAFDRGRIRKLNWDLSALPLAAFNWVEGLEIEYLRVTGMGLLRNREKVTIPALHLDLPKLEVLHCSNIGVHELDLSRVPALTTLTCSSNQLAKLDLSSVPKLTTLNCNSNRLTNLDLSRVPQLEELRCEDNQVAILDLFNLPALERLWCGKNPFSDLDLSTTPLLYKLACDESRFTKLDLSHVPALIELFWGNSRLTELDLSHVPTLEKLACDGNALTALDLSAIPMLNTIWCNDNRLTHLDLSHVPKLSWLNCEINALTNLDLSLVPELRVLECAQNRLAELDLSPVEDLASLNCSGNPLNSLDLSGVYLKELRCDRRLLETLDGDSSLVAEDDEGDEATAHFVRKSEEENW